MCEIRGRATQGLVSDRHPGQPTNSPPCSSRSLSICAASARRKSVRSDQPSTTKCPLAMITCGRERVG